MKRLGIDIGSTTLKAVLTDENGRILFSKYQRHLSRIPETATEVLSLAKEICNDEEVFVCLSGSAGMGVAESLDLPFIQEVYAEKTAVSRFYPDTDAVIELGGEDAKIIFLTGGFEMRMNGTCAGGTGAFIDQMATLMKLTPDELNELSKSHTRVYTIASRCGVFAKSDIQPLLNQGAKNEDVAAGIFAAVVNQTVAGLAQGRKIEGNVLYLGGPLTFLSELRKTFDKILGIKGTLPENSLFYVALGAALSKQEKSSRISDIVNLFEKSSSLKKYESCPPLFKNEKEYEEFRLRHRRNSEGIAELDAPRGKVFLGVDAGSTTVKILLADEKGNIIRPLYTPSVGKPIEIVLDYLKKLYADFPDIEIAGSAVTGYGEEMIKNAFRIDNGLVETVAHYTAAKKFRPDVNFILDIGGQDMKCFKIRNDLIDQLFLNEACSSGCGSFLQTFAESLGYGVEEFAKLGLFADAPVNLGSRCTVFMNSSVKQAQKDGASVENISAGLSISVVKNALYKVIRIAKAEDLGKNIVVQGGTFLNDCVLRAFEQELGVEVIRPEFSALMGAYGAALYAQKLAKGKSTLITKDEIAKFSHKVSNRTCNGCGNRCNLTLNLFADGRRYIAGNRCSKPVTGEKTKAKDDIYAYKLRLLSNCVNTDRDDEKTNIGLPLGLNNYELLPFWHEFFTELGFNVITSPFSDRKLYEYGQYSIPSDTICYPAKLIHGHIEALLREGADAIFYPDMSYNIDEKQGDDHFNCPVVAYYPQVIKLNVADVKKTKFISDFISLYDKKQFVKRIKAILEKHFPEKKFTAKQIADATEAAYAAYDEYLESIRKEGEKYLEKARGTGKPVILLAGRPYHADPEINHGIHELISRLGAIVLSEDAVRPHNGKLDTNVRNQWTYHARLYNAAKFVANAPDDLDIHLVQLVSFGCGVDAVTTDEVRSIVENSGRLYAQIKIDEISNTGAVTIRLRSLMSVLELRKNKKI